MNRNEPICHNKKRVNSCFSPTIPDRFEFDGSVNDYCSFNFPPGYSIFVEHFTLNDPGPANFVLLDGVHLNYHSEVKWRNRYQIFWEKLRKNNPLRINSIRRHNFSCVKSLKVHFNDIFIEDKGTFRCRVFSSINTKNILRSDRGLPNLCFKFKKLFIVKIRMMIFWTQRDFLSEGL